MLHTVAKLHYEADLSQVEIARRLNVSAPTISRLLRRAREEGIVRIEIPDIETPEELNQRLVQKLGLKHAAVVEAPEANLLAALAGPVGQMLREAGLRRDSVLAIGWGRAVRAVIEAGLPEIEGVITVPATGGMQQSAPHFQINEFVRLAAEQLRGTPRFIHAPYLPSPESRDAFLSDPIIHENVALWERLDAALVGIGLTHTAEGASSATPHEQALAHAAGDVVRHYFDVEGALVPWEGESRLIAVTPEQLRATPLVIGVAVSTRKVPAIRGAIRAGLVNALVTDVRTAQAVLEGA
ncbi:sugar-binding transcriptional regulator [Kaistia adipata]|uniref:sugar-binding transcriptional regulator n=1 Tax=Kaistia adipata TaxID=166954 RepID=UPI000405096D|nr:sugar-binding domain-containing protein [Kaistia adipata]